MAFGRFLRSLFHLPQLETERAKLEAFLEASPYPYCGILSNGALAYNKHFLELFDLTYARNIADLTALFKTPDDTRFEQALHKFLETDTPFTLNLKTQKHEKMLRLRGLKGQDLAGSEIIHVLWFEDISSDSFEKNHLAQKTEAAQEELKKLQTLLDYLPDAVWVYNKNARIIYCNKALQNILNAPIEDILRDQREIAFIQKQNQKNLNDLYQEVRLTKSTVQDLKFANIGGVRRTFEVSLFYGSDDFILAIAKDRTKEEDLNRDSERHISAYKGFMEHLRAAIALFGTDQRLQFYNASYAQLWQLDDHYLNTKPKLGDILEKLREQRRLPEQSDFKRYKQTWLDFFTSLINPFEEMMHLPDGTALRNLIIPHPLGGLMMMFEDVTSRLQLETSYNTLIAVQKETLDNLAEGVAAYGGDGRLKLWNPSYARMWGLNPEDMDGEPHIHRLIDKMLRNFEESEINSAKEQLLSHALERSMRDGLIKRKDGSVLEFTVVPLPDGGLLVTYIDITDTIRVENALREKTNALEAAERLKLDFLANVSYQLRTPLNAIIGFTEILDKEYFGELNIRQKEYTKGLGEAGARLMSLINDILDLSTIEAGYMSLEKASVNVAQMLKALHELTQEWARSQRIEVELKTEGALGEIEADERRLKQVLLNLIRNSIEFTPAGGRITLKAIRDAHHIYISVVDTGPGIDIQDHERIFKPFEKTNEVRNDGEGNVRGGAGLGLTLVKNIIELHNGEVELLSKIGEGTEVKITLPIV